MVRKTKGDRRNKPEQQLKTARERIVLLAAEAAGVQEKDPVLARRYCKLIKKMGMRYNVKIPADIKRNFCKNCCSFLTTGWRMKKGVRYNVCRTCGERSRYPYKPMRHK